jgi:hypothetical protein
MQNAEFRVALHPIRGVVGDRGGEGLKKPLKMENRNILLTTVGIGQAGGGGSLVHFFLRYSRGLEGLLVDLFWTDVQMLFRIISYNQIKMYERSL